MDILIKFSELTGLEMNLQKDSLLLGCVSNSKANLLSSEVGVSLEELHIKYLGLPLRSIRFNVKDCLLLLENIANRIQLWQPILLSYAGHLELIKSVLSFF